jgi:DNA-binding Lrp family transcriptional regulator
MGSNGRVEELLAELATADVQQVEEILDEILDQTSVRETDTLAALETITVEELERLVGALTRMT